MGFEAELGIKEDAWGTTHKLSTDSENHATWKGSVPHLKPPEGEDEDGNEILSGRVDLCNNEAFLTCRYP